MLVEAIGTPLPPLSKCFLLTGNKKGGSAKAEVKSGWYGALHNRAAVFYNRGGAGVTGLMMETVPPSPIQAYKRIFCSTRRRTEKRKATKKKGGGGIQTKHVRLKNLPAPAHPEKGNASQRLRDSSGPRLNSSGWTLIYRWSLSDTLEKGSEALCLRHRGQWATRARISRDALGACLPLALSSLQTPAAVKAIGGVSGRAGDKARPLEVSLRGYYGQGKYLRCEDGTLHFVNGSYPCGIIATRHPPNPAARLSGVQPWPIHSALGESPFSAATKTEILCSPP